MNKFLKTTKKWPKWIAVSIAFFWLSAILADNNQLPYAYAAGSTAVLAMLVTMIVGIDEST